MSLALLRTTTPCSYSLFLNTHLVPMMFLPLGLSTSSLTSFLVKLFSSSCMALVEDVTPGIHMVAQYNHLDRGWVWRMLPRVSSRRPNTVTRIEGGPGR